MKTQEDGIDFRKACMELLDWTHTGILCEGEVRKLAELRQDIPEHMRLQVAEARVKYWALSQLATNADQSGKVERIVNAGNAVVDRWNSPLWKDVPHTATFIHALRDALSSYQEVQDAASHEPNTIEEILFYWAERSVMLELLAEGGGGWRVYALNPDGTEHEGDGDNGCHWDVTHIMQVTHYQLRHRGMKRDEPRLFPYPTRVDRPEARWFERGEAARYADEVMPKFKLDTSDPETQRCLGEIRESMRTGKPVPPRAAEPEGADEAS